MPGQKILIITYYWPPSGGSGVQRWLKFAKYLPQFGWQPVVFTPQNPALVQQDESLMKDVPAEAEIIRFPIWEPYDAFFKLSSIFGRGGKTVKPSQLTVRQGRSLFQKLASWIRGNFFIPDPKIFWVKPSVKFLETYLKQNNIRTVITTGPPHSMHLIGYKLKKNDSSLNWIADFRDPWSEWPFLDSFNMTLLTRSKHKKLEKNVLTTADHVVTITPFYQKRFEKLSGRSVTLFTNGFDESDFNVIQYHRPEKFTIRHVGIVYEMANASPLIKAITLLCGESNEFRENTTIEFIGEVNATFREACQQSAVNKLVLFKDPVPHKDLMKLYGSTSVLLLNLDGYQDAEGLMPGKLFEYLATGLPVLGIGPKTGDAAMVLEETKAGEMFDGENIFQIQKFLMKHFDAWKNDAHGWKPPNDRMKYSRKEITQRLTEIL